MLEELLSASKESKRINKIIILHSSEIPISLITSYLHNDHFTIITENRKSLIEYGDIINKETKLIIYDATKENYDDGFVNELFNTDKIKTRKLFDNIEEIDLSNVNHLIVTNQA